MFSRGCRTRIWLAVTTITSILLFAIEVHARCAKQDPSQEYFKSGNNKCRLCPPGFYLNEPCTKKLGTSCRACPAGHYMAYYNSCPECQLCTYPCHHDNLLEEVKNCTSTHNRECRCMEGSYLFGDTCKEVACPPGRRVSLQGVPVCRPCPKLTYSGKRNNLTTCTPKTNCIALGLKTTWKGNKTHDAICKDKHGEVSTTSDVKIVTAETSKLVGTTEATNSQFKSKSIRKSTSVFLDGTMVSMTTRSRSMEVDNRMKTVTGNREEKLTHTVSTQMLPKRMASSNGVQSPRRQTGSFQSSTPQASQMLSSTSLSGLTQSSHVIRDKITMATGEFKADKSLVSVETSPVAMKTDHIAMETDQVAMEDNNDNMENVAIVTGTVAMRTDLVTIGTDPGVMEYDSDQDEFEYATDTASSTVLSLEIGNKVNMNQETNSWFILKITGIVAVLSTLTGILAMACVWCVIKQLKKRWIRERNFSNGKRGSMFYNAIYQKNLEEDFENIKLKKGKTAEDVFNIISEKIERDSWRTFVRGDPCKLSNIDVDDIEYDNRTNQRECIYKCLVLWKSRLKEEVPLADLLRSLATIQGTLVDDIFENCCE